MRKLTCHGCGRITDEASADWDRASSTGRCPRCSHFFDQTLESQVSMLSQDHGLRRENARTRLRALISGLALLALGISLTAIALLNGAVIAIWLWPVGLIVTGGGLTLFAVLYNPEAEARRQLGTALDASQLDREN